MTLINEKKINSNLQIHDFNKRPEKKNRNKIQEKKIC